MEGRGSSGGGPAEGPAASGKGFPRGAPALEPGRAGRRRRDSRKRRATSGKESRDNPPEREDSTAGHRLERQPAPAENGDSCVWRAGRAGATRPTGLMEIVSRALGAWQVLFSGGSGGEYRGRQ